MTERPDRFVLASPDWQTIIDALHDGVAVLERGGRILACNRAAAAIYGSSTDELVGRTTLELRMVAVREDGSALPPDAYPSAQALRSGAPVRESVIGVHDRNGNLRWLLVSATPTGAEARPAAVVVTFSDVTERRDYEAELRRLAEVDELTGLPNRRAFLAALGDHLASRRREDARGALLVLDFDHFKQLNDTLGHAVGDRMLVNAATALAERLRATDLMGRIGGDEFAVLLPRADNAEAERVAAALAARLRKELVPTARGGVRQLTASIGVVPLAGAAGASVDRALRRADDAMYAAKSSGRDGWQLAAAQSAPLVEGSGNVAAQLAKRARQLALANALGARLSGMTDTHEIADATVEELHRAFGYHMCAVIRIREDEHVDALAVRGPPFVALIMRDWSQPVTDGVIGRCLRERATVLVNDVRTDPDYAATPETADVRSELVVPLVVDDATWGAINLEELVEDAFDDDDAQLLCIVANQVAAAIRSAILRNRLDQAERALTSS
jgi:diguanylate cyclase (GGDEF)-like protein/PAS domain S-box-containing protein